MKKLEMLTAALVIVGGLNWGLVAIAEFDLVAALVGLDFGETNAASRVVYGLVGLAAAYQLATSPAPAALHPRPPSGRRLDSGEDNDMRQPLTSTLLAAALAVRRSRSRARASPRRPGSGPANPPSPRRRPPSRGSRRW